MIKCMRGLLAVWMTSLPAEPSDGYEPLYAGTQLAFYSTNADPGHLSVQPYFFLMRRSHVYDQHWHLQSQTAVNGMNTLLSVETGLTHWLDISLDLNQAYQQAGRQQGWVWGDTTLYLGLQLARDHKNSAIPDIRLLVGEVFPTGKYDRLDPRRKGSDIFGQGAFVTTVILVVAKNFYTYPQHPFNLNLNLYYLHSSPVPIHKYSMYGGSFDTRGRVFPGASFITNLAVECSLNQAWALGMDMHYVHQNKTPFKGKKGSARRVGLSSSEQLSLAPCLEYCWSENFSMSFGPWFSIAGRNSSAFFGLMGNIYSYF